MEREHAGALVDVEQTAARLRDALLLGRGEAHLQYRNLRLLGEEAHGLREGDVLDLLHESEDIAQNAGAEASDSNDAFGGIYDQYGSTGG